MCKSCLSLVDLSLWADNAANVYSYGDVREHGYGVYSDDIAVRPALWIDLNALER